LQNGSGYIIRQVPILYFAILAVKALITKKVTVSKGNWERLSTVDEFSNWKDATRAF